MNCNILKPTIFYYRFQARVGFPGVIGAIDCTLPSIHSPVEHEEAYVDHHQNHSLNVQVVCI